MQEKIIKKIEKDQINNEKDMGEIKSKVTENKVILKTKIEDIN